VQFRAEVRVDFSSVEQKLDELRGEMHALHSVASSEMQKLHEGSLSQARTLHEHLVEQIKTIKHR
jgi:hypothetical protein